MSVRSKSQPTVRKVLAAAAITGVLALGLSACGGDGSGGGGDTVPGPAHQPRGSSVGEGDGAPPPIAAEVTAAARAAGCTLRAFPSEGRGHVEVAPTYRQSLPPTSGPHNPVWAEWGIYDAPVPAQFQVHNLEHGGVIVHRGDALPDDAVGALRALWGDEPAYILLVPGNEPSFPPDAVVVTSWQRWMVCKPFSAKTVDAVRVFAETYRGAGPEPVAALNSPDTAAGLPKPSEPDPAAEH